MKIALVNHTFSLSHGGLERFSVNLATALQNEGHEVHVYAYHAESVPGGIKVHLMLRSGKPVFRRILRFLDEVRLRIKGERFDIVYGLTRFFPADFYRLGDGVHRHWMRIRYPFAPYRWLNYLINPVHLVNIFLEKRIFQPENCRRIITNSQLVKDHAQKYYGVSSDRIQVVYNGVDHTLFCPEKVRSFRSSVRQELGLAQDDIALLHVSNNWKRKGLAVILKAVAQLGKEGQRLHVIVVGRGKPGYFQRLARRLGVANRLHIVGATSEVQKYYGAGDLLVLPTLYDPFSNVCLEAMACGVPVITTAENGASELLKNGENGYVQSDARDPRELAQLLRHCLEKEPLEQMGQNACRTSLPYTRKRNMRQNVELFQQVLEEKAS